VAHLNKLVIFGVGLIGGSFALALREAQAVDEIVGVGRSWENLSAALGLYVIDTAVADEAGVAAALKGADLVVLAMPVGQMGAVMARIAPLLEPQTVVTDAGSTKQDVVALARQHLAAHVHRFVPGHPIAGAERSGVKAASEALFRNRQVVLTPLRETDAEATDRVRALWQACGARVAEMAPEAHDRIFAAVSHLPHLLAFALVDEIARRPNAAELFSYAASGFRDFTRIAGSSPEMWRDIGLANQTALVEELDAYLAQLSRLRDALVKGDGAALEQVFSNARAARNAWVQGNSEQ
jgi:prephenate dehydrogenase